MAFSSNSLYGMLGRVSFMIFIILIVTRFPIIYWNVRECLRYLSGRHGVDRQILFHLVYKLRRVKGEANFTSSGSKIVKRLRRRQYDPALIERTIGLVLGPFTALYRSFLKRCTLTNKAVGTIWRALSKPPQRRQGPDPRPLWLLVGTPSAFGPELAYRLRVAQPTLMDVARYFWYTLILLYMFVYYIFMTSPLWLAVGPQSI